MSKVFLIILTLLVFQQSAHTQTFSKLNSGTLSPLYDVAFTDEKKGFAVGGSGTLLQTNDGGATWQSREVPSRDNLKKIVFTNAEKGWILCEKARYSSRGGEPLAYLLATDDGGANWTRQEIGEVSNILLTQIFPTKQGELFAVGEAGTIFQQSRNGWQKIVSESLYLLLDGKFQSERRAVVVGGGNTVLRTEDSGRSWVKVSLADNQSSKLFSVEWIGEKSGLIVGANGRILATTNAGITWTTRNSPVNSDLQDVFAFSDTKVFAVGAEGVILLSSDRGNSWRKIKSPVTHTLNGAFVKGKNIFIVGFGGIILRAEM